MSSSAIQTYEQGAYLTQWREPEEVLAEATKAAIALKKVVSMKEKPVMFNGEQYLEREDWGTVAKFYGCTAKTIETHYVEFGTERGFEAVAVVIDRNMNEIGRAESMCLSGEANWGDVPVYKWKDELDANGKKIWVEGKNGKKGYYKGEKVQEGTTAKPLFQLRSMAQTRAEAKALKGVFSWVVVLAGYRPSVAEEMTGNENFEDREQEQKKPPVTQPTRTSDKKPAAQTAQAATQPATQGEQQTAGDEVSGIIKEAVVGTNGIAKLTVGDKTVVVAADKYEDGMVTGKFIKFRGSKRHSDKVGDYFVLEGLRELTDVQEGEPATEGKMDPENAALAEDLFGEKVPAGKEAVQGLVDSGQLKPASQLPATKAGTIGKGRRLRLLGMCNTNKEKNNGFNHDEIHRIIESWPPPIGPIMHIADIPIDLHPQFEKWATGEDDFREYWKD